MIYLGVVQDFDAVKKTIENIGKKYTVPGAAGWSSFFVQTGENQWETGTDIGTCKKSFSVWDSIPLKFEGHEKFNTFFRVGETSLEMLLQGPGVEKAANEARETKYNKHTIVLEQAGPNLGILAIPAGPGLTAEQKTEQTVVVQSWVVRDTVFGELIYNLWEGNDFIAYDGNSKNIRQDIEFTIIGDQYLMPKGYEPKRKELFVPTAYDLFNLPQNMGSGEGESIYETILGDASHVEMTGEDGNVVDIVDFTAQTSEDGQLL